MSWLSTMPAFSPAPTPPQAGADGEMLLLLGLLRQIRAGGQYLDGALAALETSLALTGEAARLGAVREEGADVANKISESTAVTQQSLSDALSLVEASPYLRNWVGDEVTKTQLYWGESSREATAVRTELQRIVNDSKATIGEELARNVKEARAAVREVVVATAMITIPPRLAEFLDEARVGQTLTFKSMFENELPDEADRTEIIRRIAEAPADMPGVIDVDTASVVVISRNIWRRRRSYLLEANALLGGGLVTFLVIAASRGLYATGDIFHPADVATAQALRSLGNLLLIFAGGALLHFVIDLVKARQGTAGAPRWVVLDDWLLWMHAREVKVLGSIAALWFVFGGLMAINTGPLPDALTVLLAGYSFDSLADVVIKRFDSFATPQIAKVSSALAGTP
jgi:hypothetical protein